MPEIRRFRPWPGILRPFLALLLLAAGAGGAGGGGIAPTALAKPLPPLSVFWHVDSSAREGPAVHRVAVTLSALADLDELWVRVLLPEGFDLSEGPTEWRGPLAGGAALTLPLVVRAPGPGRVTLRIEARTASNVHFSRDVVVHVPEPLERQKAPERPTAPPSGPTPGIREFPSR